MCPETRAASASAIRAPKSTSATSYGLHQSAGQVVGGDLLVDGVRLDVLVEVVPGRLAEAEPAEPVRVPPVGNGRRHLERREMTDDRAAQPALQAEE
jgi:hypothetical protein